MAAALDLRLNPFALIKNFWSKVWVRPSVDLNALAEKVDRACDAVGFRAAQVTASWAPCSANVFAAQVLKFKDKAAGPDGWLGNELVDWPIDFFDFFASFCATCEKSSLLACCLAGFQASSLEQGRERCSRPGRLS